MDLRDKLRNPFVQQYILEILIPLAGYFWFDWTIEIIALFYLIDQFASEFSFLRKLKSVAAYHQMSFSRQLIISTFSFVIFFVVESIILFHFFSERISEKEGFRNIYSQIEIFAIEEGWLLLPLVFLMYYMKDQFTFYMPRKFVQKDPVKFFKWHLISETIIFSLVVCGALLFSITFLNDYLLIIIFLCIKISFDLTIQKMAELKSNQ